MTVDKRILILGKTKMTLIIFKHIKKVPFNPVREISTSASMPRLAAPVTRRAPRPIRRAGAGIVAQPIVAPVVPVRQAVNSLQNSLPSGIELNLARRSDSMDLHVQADPPGYWAVEEETRAFWGHS